jgi:DNA polymerase III delta prime subunit
MSKLLYKYRPNKFSDINISNYDIELIEKLSNNNDLNLIITGNYGTGKTSLIDIIISNYYNFDKLDNNKISYIKNNNILYINILNEQGINYYRNEVNSFCMVKSLVPMRNKFLVIDSIDILTEQNQYIFKNYLDLYSNINFLISSIDLTKIYESLLHKLNVIKINETDNNWLNKIYNYINDIEKFDIEKQYTDKFINIANKNISNLINIIEKYILNDKIFIQEFDTLNEFDRFFSLCKKKQIEECYSLLLNICNFGISIYDILERLNSYIKNTDTLDIEIKYKLYKILIYHINQSYTIYLDKIQLLFLVNSIIHIL